MPATMNRATIAITPGSHIFKEVVFGMVLAAVWESRGLHFEPARCWIVDTALAIGVYRV